MDVFYWEDKEKQIDFLLNESQSQAKELEGLRERLKDGEFIWAEAMKHDGGCDCGNVTGEGITDACNKLLSQDTTQPDTKQKD